MGAFVYMRLGALLLGIFFAVLVVNLEAFRLSTTDQAIAIWNRLVGRHPRPKKAPQPALKYRGIERQDCGKECTVRYGNKATGGEKVEGKVRIQRMEQQNSSVKLKALSASVIFLFIFGGLLLL